MKDEFDKKLKQFVVWTLRKASYRWAPRYKALKKAQVGKDQFRCASCQKIFSRKEVQIDHITPVINPDKGFTNWNDYIKRMFCNEEGYQTLCKPHHKEKTQSERKKSRERIKRSKDKIASPKRVHKKAIP